MPRKLARKKRLALDVVLMAVAAIPVTLVDQAAFRAGLQEAKRRIGRRDPDSVEILAPALHAGLPVWSNDDDFREAGVESLARGRPPGPTAEPGARRGSGAGQGTRPTNCDL